MAQLNINLHFGLFLAGLLSDYDLVRLPDEFLNLKDDSTTVDETAKYVTKYLYFGHIISVAVYFLCVYL